MSQLEFAINPTLPVLYHGWRDNKKRAKDELKEKTVHKIAIN